MSNWQPGYLRAQLSRDVEHDQQPPGLAQQLYGSSNFTSDIPSSTYTFEGWMSAGSLQSPGVDFQLDLAPYHEGVSKIEDISIHDLTTGLDAQPWHGVVGPQAHTTQTLPLHQYDVSGPLVGQDETYGSFSKLTDEGYISLGFSGSGQNALYELPSYTPQYTDRNQAVIENGLKRKASTCAPSETQSQRTSVSTRRRSSGPVENCSVCGRISKNRSDANKHAKTHEKPYKCRILGCSKNASGFGTPNDCQRHELCKHQIIPSNTLARGWICSACPSTDTPAKWWPRLDNFRAHLKRKHKNLSQDHDTIVRLSQQDFRPNETISEKDEVFSASYSNYNSTSHADTEMQYQYEFACQPFQPALSARQNIQAGEGMPWLDEPNIDHLADLVIPRRTDSDILSLRQHDSRTHATDRDGRPEAQLPACSGAAVPSLAIDDSFYHLGSMMLADEVLPRGMHDLNVEDEAKRQDTTTTQPVKGIDEDDMKGVVCERCNYGREAVNGQRKQLRQCDLNKHIRGVHDRVYGCTHPHCQHTSRSKSDWRRHELAKHRCPAAWLCRVRRSDGTFCNQYFMNDDDLWARHHLRTEHQLPKCDLSRVIDAYKLPRAGMTRFWCGFCNEVQPNPAQDATEAWEYRLSHIGEHMDMKGDRSIKDWICPEWQMPKGSITPTMEADFLLRPPPPMPPQEKNWS